MENLCNIQVIKKIFARHHFTFSKGLGQNFLVDPEVCPRIADEGISSPDFGVIEIGTGVGVLTNELAKKAKKVVAIEIDKRLLPILKETLAEHDNVKIINADVMKLDLRQLIEEEFPDMEVCVCANLPYYITSPIVMLLLEERLPIRSITVMVQKEAATRLCAALGTRECGAVTFAVNYYSQAHLLFNVNRDSFMPSPNVDSAVIKLDVRQDLPVSSDKEVFMFAVVKAAFSQRRKTLANPVSAAFNLPKSAVLAALSDIGLKSTARAEELTAEDFAALSEKLL